MKIYPSSKFKLNLQPPPIQLDATPISPNDNSFFNFDVKLSLCTFSENENQVIFNTRLGR